jgi:DNA-binding SARP family transcriptional activator
MQPTIAHSRVSPPIIGGLVRERLVSLAPNMPTRLCLVVAPAGFGKTTLLSHIAATIDGPVAWHWTERRDEEDSVFWPRLLSSLRTAAPHISGECRTVEDVALALQSRPNEGICLLIDDFHLLRGTPGEAIIDRFLELPLPELRLVIASRVAPSLNSSRLRLADAVHEVGPDDLRFRFWEAERLFRDVYGESVFPSDLVDITRRTSGWAAGLQLFHLATRDKVPNEKRRILAELGPRTRYVREYLTRNVLEELPPSLREFLSRTCVLPHLSGPTCDAFLGTTGSAVILRELEQRELFTSLVGDAEEYRYHDILRRHLEEMLAQQIGEEEVRELYRRAALVLETNLHVSDALYAYCRGEAWSDVSRLLGAESNPPADPSDGLYELLPSSIGEHDPWLQLAQARQERSAGRLAAAIGAYRRAEDHFESSSLKDVCRRERLTLESMADPTSIQRDDWLGLILAAAWADPLGRAREALEDDSDPGWAFAAGIATLLGGEDESAKRLLRRVADDPRASRALVACALTVAAVVELLEGDAQGTADLEIATDEAERLGLLWLARIGRAALILSDRPDGPSECASARLASEALGDPWGASISALFEGISALRGREVPRARLEQAAARFHQIGATVLEAWVESTLALWASQSNGSDADRRARHAAVLARRARVPGALVLARYAQQINPSDAGAKTRPETKPWVVAERRPSTKGMLIAAPSHAEVHVRCFGPFQISISGVAVDMHAVKPHARTALHYLALRAGRPIHREVLAEALWPNAHPDQSIRGLHVVISSLRHVLEPGVARGQSSFILREGEAYQFALKDGVSVDVLEFDRLIKEARASRAEGAIAEGIASFEQALALYIDEVLPEDGPASWVTDLRETFRLQAAEASLALAQLLFDSGDVHGAVLAAEHGVRCDPYRDDLWRTLIRSSRMAGDVAAAVRAEAQYADILSELDGAPEISNPSY